MRIVVSCLFVLASTLSFSVTAVDAAPDYHDAVLHSIYPAGAQAGQTVEIKLTGNGNSLVGATRLIIDGPPGIRVDQFDASQGTITATLVIAPDAIPGRRMIRVVGGVAGLTSFRWFFVGALPEHVETDKNNELSDADQVTLPVVANGRVAPALDQDCFRFKASAGQSLVLAVMSHGLDAMEYNGRGGNFTHTSLEFRDSEGRSLAESGDELGLDPLIEFRVPADGEYIARVSGMGYGGDPGMIYRLTMGEVPYPAAVFPAGGQRGETVTVEFSGPNVPPGSTTKVFITDEPGPVQYVSLPPELPNTCQLPLLRGNVPEQPTATGSSAENPLPLPLPSAVYGRFLNRGDAGWYLIEATKDEAIDLAVTAQQHLRSPIDTVLEVRDAKGKVLAANDDGEIFSSECLHEFVPFDSFLTFTPPADGTYLVRVAEQSGSIGPRSMYRLEARRSEPDFHAYQWPDAVPIWGPGSSAALVIETHRLGNLTADINLRIEGLPEGWQGSETVAQNRDYKPPRSAFGHKCFMTITAPPDAHVGDVVEFRVVARAEVDGRVIEHIALPLTQILWQEPNRFRPSPVARAAIAPPQKFHLQAATREITATPGQTVQVPVKLHFAPEAKRGQMSLSINRAGTHFKCNLGPQVNVDGSRDVVDVPLQVPDNFEPGTYRFVIADAWSSETRKGLPGPSTELILLTVEKK